jgi:hypothetical protein
VIGPFILAQILIISTYWKAWKPTINRLSIVVTQIDSRYKPYLFFLCCFLASITRYNLGVDNVLKTKLQVYLSDRADLLQQVRLDWEGKWLKSLISELLVDCEILIDCKAYYASAKCDVVRVHEAADGLQR